MSLPNKKKKTLSDAEKAIIAQLHEVWQTDIVAFAKDVFGATLTPKQTEIVNAFRDNQLITVRGGAGFGKTFSMAVLLWWALMTHDEVQVTIFGPNENQLTGAFWNEVLSLHGKMDPLWADAYDATATKVARKSAPADCFGEFRLAKKDNPAGARGIHKRNNFVFVDEATGVDRELFTDAFMNIMSDPNPKLCLVSNPDKIDSYFYDTFYDDNVSQGWVKVHGTMRDGAFMTDEKYEQIASKYGGVTTSKYRVMALGEFPLSDEDALIPRDAVQEAVECTTAIPSRDVPRYWGLDPSGQGNDRTVLMQRHDNVATLIATWTKFDTIQIAEAVLAEYNRTPPKDRPTKICVDVIGLGNGVADAMARYGLPVTRVTVSNTPTRKPHLYTKLRDQLWFECAEWLIGGNVSIPNHPDLIRELCSPTYEDAPKIKVESKKDMRKRLKVSPDFADALCLTFFHGTKLGTVFASKITYTDLHAYE